MRHLAATSEHCFRCIEWAIYCEFVMQTCDSMLPIFYLLYLFLLSQRSLNLGGPLAQLSVLTSNVEMLPVGLANTSRMDRFRLNHRVSPAEGLAPQLSGRQRPVGTTVLPHWTNYRAAARWQYSAICWLCYPETENHTYVCCLPCQLDLNTKLQIIVHLPLFQTN